MVSYGYCFSKGGKDKKQQGKQNNISPQLVARVVISIGNKGAGKCKPGGKIRTIIE